MKKVLTISFITFVFLSSEAGIINGSFENGDFSGWSFDITGGYASTYIMDENGEIIDIIDYNDLNKFPDLFQVVSSFNPSITTFDHYTATDGNYFSYIPGQDLGDVYLAYDNKYSIFDFRDCAISIYQNVFLHAGQTINGNIAFMTTDYYDNDRAIVSITKDSYYSKPAEIRVSDIYDPNNYQGNWSDWKEWEWSAPSDGIYKISLSNYMDDQYESIAYFDNIHIANVPEPQSVTYYLITFCCLAILSILPSRLKLRRVL